MRFAGAVSVGVLAVLAGGLLSIASGQQPAGMIQPVVATLEASAGPAGQRASVAVWMPSRVAGHLADRLQALHDTSSALDSPISSSPTPSKSAASKAPAEMASRSPLPDASTAGLAPTAPLTTTSPAPTPAPATRRNPFTAERPSFGIGNPLRGAR